MEKNDFVTREFMDGIKKSIDQKMHFLNNPQDLMLEYTRLLLQRNRQGLIDLDSKLTKLEKEFEAMVQDKLDDSTMSM